MTKKVFWAACFLTSAALWNACQSEGTPAAVEIRMEEYHFLRCDRDSLCAEVRVTYPVVSSTDAALAQRLNDSLQAILMQALEPTDEDMAHSKPFRERLENIGPKLLESVVADFGQDTSVTYMTYSVEAICEMLLNAPRYLSMEISSYSYMGGAHGMGYVSLFTLHKADGRAVQELTEIVADTAALRPLVEQAFLEANRAKEVDGEVSLESLLLEPDMPLPLPLNFCVVPEGIRMIYNPYEVTAYALGPTDFVLAWEQLGRLANRDKWLK